MTLEADILAAEARRFDAILRADPVQLRECLHEQLVYVHSNAVVEDRETYIGKIVSGQYKYLGFAPGARQIRVLADDAVASIGHLDVRSAAGAVHLIATAVYRRTAGQWQMALWHACAEKRA